MSHEVSHGAASRRPVYSGKRRITGLYERRRADSSTAYEARLRPYGGAPRLVLLDATTKTEAFAELQDRTRHLRVRVPCEHRCLCERYAGVSETAKAKIASKLVDAGFGS
jgi:hypothetical protein